MRTKTLVPTLLVLSLVLALPLIAAEEAEPEPPKLLGQVTLSAFSEAPYSEWYGQAYQEYIPNAEVLAELRKLDRTGLEITVFFGTWCGDSRREVPRIVKLLEMWEFPTASLKLIAVDNTDEALKQSPTGEQLGREIYRVPTLIVERAGTELSRLVEYPVRSLERDLSEILAGARYEPSYASYPVVRDWLATGLLGDPNVSPRGLANKLRHSLASEGELSAVARVLLVRGQLQEAVKLYRINCDVYPQSEGCASRLATALFAAGDQEGARSAAERALRLNDDPERVAEIVDLIERITVASAQADG